jgi:hypothetical protein
VTRAPCRLALATLLVALSCRPSAPADAGGAELPRDAASSAPATSSSPPAIRAKDTAMKSYSTSWASPTRNSRVSAPARRFEALTKIVSLSTAPRYVLVNEKADHVALDYGSRWEVREGPAAAGAVVTAAATKVTESPLEIWPTSLLVDGREHDFAGKAAGALAEIVSGSGDRVWAFEVGTDDASAVLLVGARTYQTSEKLANGGAATVWNKAAGALRVLSEHFHGANRTMMLPVWTVDLPGWGCGAIADDRRIAVAMGDQRFLAYDSRRVDAEGTTQPIATSQLAFVPYDISVVDGGVAVLSGGQGRTSVHLLDWQGHELWQASVPFDIDSPPVEAGAGRVYLVGKGFAAAEHGATLWAQPTQARAFATAVDDGSALLAVGPELRHVSRDGSIVQSLRVPEGDAIVTPPAVAADGSAWVATDKGLYVAK